MRLFSSIAASLALAGSATALADPTSVRPATAPALTDVLTLGDPNDEGIHGLTSTQSESLMGGLGEKARRLLPRVPQSWQGGGVAFTLKVDPVRSNYFTIKLWGDDVSDDRLLLFAEGKQVGYRHLGDIDQLDFGSGEPAYSGRFFYNTVPLPPNITQGKHELHCEIRSIGRIWGYGQNFAQYQKTMVTPTRGIYRVYSGTSGYFLPPADERQGGAPVSPPLAAPGPEVLDSLKARVKQEIEGRLRDSTPLSQTQMQLLARAYFVNWTKAYHNPQVVGRVQASLDALYIAFRKNPKLARAEPSTWNPDWFGLGVAGQVLWLLSRQLAPGLDAIMDDGAGARVTRRDAYGEMLLASRDWHRLNRRLYTNQTMINDLYGIYYSNRGLEVVAPEKALSEVDARRYLYESLGLQPWRDSDAGGHQWAMGANYMQLTAKGLTKELGYVGTYGEVLDWVNAIYAATRPAPGEPGDPKIKAQLVKIAEARAAMRHPALDAEGRPCMRLEQVIGWRDAHYPGEVVYGQRQTRDASPLETAFNTADSGQIGYARQMLEDGQFFAGVQNQMKEAGLRVTGGLLETPDQCAWLLAQPKTARRLPMSWDQPDHVFTDEEDGVVALKHGDELLYISLYWRARHAINNLARVHFITPHYDRIAVVRQDTQFEPSGLTFTRRDITNFGFGNGGLKYPEEWHSANAGEAEPIARIPADVPFKPGDESVYAGKGSFYTLRYGPYLIGMNMTTDMTYPLKSTDAATDLMSGKMVKSGQSLTVMPRGTVILWTSGG